MKTESISLRRSPRDHVATRVTITAATAILCLGAAGYIWETRGSMRQNADMATTTLHRSTDTTERDQAAVVVTNEVIRLLDALRTAAARGGESGERAAQMLARLAEHARKP